VVGDDSRVGTVDEGTGGHADPPFRSDTIMLVRVDPTNHQFTIVSVPRDTKTDLDGTPGKLNYQYALHGNEGLVQRVSEMTGVPIDYYIDTTFVGFENLVDKMGGIDVNVPIAIEMSDIVHGDYIELDAGQQHLDGEEALMFARMRKAYQEMDSTRQYNDRAILVSMMQKALNNPDKATEYAKDLMDTVHETNMPADALAYYLKEFLANADKVTFYSGSFPAEGGIDPETNQWLAYYDPAMWNSIMAVVKEGGDPNTVYQPPFG
jgi:LCP family protein required for cell wall assembly